MFKQAIRIGLHDEPNYDYFLNSLTFLRDRALNSEGFPQEIIAPHPNGIPMIPLNNESFRIVSRMKDNIDSKVKISGLDNIKSISTLQQNNTLNSINFTNCKENMDGSQGLPPLSMEKKQSTFRKEKKHSKFVTSPKKDGLNLGNPKISGFKKEISESVSDSMSPARSEESKAIRLFKGNQSPNYSDGDQEFSEEEKSFAIKKNKVKAKEVVNFPSFESDERDENIPKLCKVNKDCSVSEDSIDDIINIKIFTYRRNLLVKDYSIQAHSNHDVMKRQKGWDNN